MLFIQKIKNVIIKIIILRWCFLNRYHSMVLSRCYYLVLRDRLIVASLLKEWSLLPPTHSHSLTHPLSLTQTHTKTDRQTDIDFLFKEQSLFTPLKVWFPVYEAITFCIQTTQMIWWFSWPSQINCLKRCCTKIPWIIDQTSQKM